MSNKLKYIFFILNFKHNLKIIAWYLKSANIFQILFIVLMVLCVMLFQNETKSVSEKAIITLRKSGLTTSGILVQLWNKFRINITARKV